LSPFEHLQAARAAFVAGDRDAAMEHLSLATGNLGWQNPAKTRRDLHLYLDRNHLYQQTILRLAAHEQCKHDRLPRGQIEKLFDTWREEGVLEVAGAGGSDSDEELHERHLRRRFAHWAVSQSPTPALILPEVSLNGKKLDLLCLEQPVRVERLTAKDRIFRTEEWLPEESALAFPEAVRCLQVDKRYLRRLSARLAGTRCWVVELKMTLNMEAIGQVLSYRVLLNQAHPELSVSRVLIGCHRPDPTLDAVCQKHEIQVVNL